MSQEPIRIQLQLHAEGLKNIAGIFKGISDPYAVVSIAGGHVPGYPEGTEIGRTETVKNSLHPDWAKVIFFNFQPGTFLPVRVAIYDDNGDRDDVLMGEADFECSEILSSGEKERVDNIEKGGKLFMHVDESIQGTSMGDFDLRLRGLDIKNVESGLLGLGRSDPFFEIAKKFVDHSSGIVRWNVVYRSERIMDNLNPYWKALTLTTEELCNADLELPLRITVFDWEKSGKHRAIGMFETTASGLVANVSQRGNADRQHAFELTKEGKVKTKGLIVVVSAEVRDS